MEQRPELVKLEGARSETEARLVVMVLQDAGIPAYINETQCQDEFATTQRLIGTMTDISVAAEHFEDAMQAIAETESSAEVETVPPPPKRVSHAFAWCVILGPLGMLYVMSFAAFLWIVVPVSSAIGIVAWTVPEAREFLATLGILLYFFGPLCVSIPLVHRCNRRLAAR